MRHYLLHSNEQLGAEPELSVLAPGTFRSTMNEGGFLADLVTEIAVAIATTDELLALISHCTNRFCAPGPCHGCRAAAPLDARRQAALANRNRRQFVRATTTWRHQALPRPPRACQSTRARSFPTMRR